MKKTVEERLDRIERKIGIEPELPPKPAPPFKRGDRVRCIDPNGCSLMKMGATYVVQEVGAVSSSERPGAVDFLIHVGDASTGAFVGSAFDFRFELAKPEFKKGDRVRVKDGQGGPRDYLVDGTVHTVDEVKGPGSLRGCLSLVGHEGEFWFESRFELLPPEQAKFKYPAVEVLGWPEGDGSFTLILAPVGPNGEEIEGADKLFYSVHPKTQNLRNFGIYNLNEWHVDSNAK